MESDRTRPSGFVGALVDLYAELRARDGAPSLAAIASRVQALRGSRPARSTVSDALSGRKVPRGDLAAAIAAALGGSRERQDRARYLAESAAADRPSVRVNAATSNAAKMASSSGWWIRSGYIEQVREIAPAGGLLHREAELLELDAFCRSDGRYLWLQAGPWAGKSALLSAFVLHPPAGVEVVSFFVTGRLAGQADSTAFTDALLDQLSAIVAEPLPPALSSSSRDALRRALLRAAAEKVARDGRRMVLVVDGLDEDRGAVSGSGLPSVASLLPRSPDRNLRVIVASRSNPPLPDDVPDEHMLRHCRIWEIAQSLHAAKIATRAKQELREHLAGDLVHRDIVGFMTASGGGLSVRELEELTDQPPYVLDGVLSGPLGRTVGRRTEQIGVDPQQLYLFAHETLHEEAVLQLGTEVLAYRRRICAWADTYGRRGWPPETPQYLLRGYFRMLKAVPDPHRLFELATDGRRHDRLLDVTGGDMLALAEVTTALSLKSGRSTAELLRVVRLATYRDDLVARNTAIPTGLPAVWARLRQPVRAESLAHCIPDTERQVRAFVQLARTLAEIGDGERAMAVVDRIPAQQAEERASIAEAFAAAGDYDNAEKVARSIGDPNWCDTALANVAVRAAQAGAVGQAQAITATITDPDSRMQAIRELATALAANGEYEAAQAAIADITDPARRTDAAADLAKTMVIASETPTGSGEASQPATLPVPVEQGESSRRIAAAEASVRHILDPWRRDRELEALASTLAANGNHDGAAAVADSIVDSNARQRAACDLLMSAANDGHDNWARHWARALPNEGNRRFALLVAIGRATERGDYGRAEALATDISPIDQLWLLTTLARWVTQADQPEIAAKLATRVETLARSYVDSDANQREITTLAIALIEASHHDLALEFAGAITHPDHRTWIIGDLAAAAARAGRYETADRAAVQLTDPNQRANLLVSLAEAAAEQHDQNQTGQYLEQAATAIGEIADPYRRVRTTRWLTHVAATAGMQKRASQLIAEAELVVELLDPPVRADLLIGLVHAAAAAGDAVRAARLADQLEVLATSLGPEKQAAMLACLSSVLATDGDHTRAGRLVDYVAEIAIADDPERRARMLTAQLAPLLLNGDRGRAANLISDITAAADELGNRARAQTLRELAATLTDAAAFDLAHAVAGTIADPALKGSILVDLLEAAVAADDRTVAYLVVEALASEETRARFHDPSGYASALTRSALHAAAVGDTDLASRLASEAAAAAVIVPAPRRIATLIDCAAALASRGNSGARYVEQANVLIETINDPSEQADAFAKLSELPGHARHLTAVFAITHWLTHLTALARVDPAALAQLAQERLARAPTSIMPPRTAG